MTNETLGEKRQVWFLPQILYLPPVLIKDPYVKVKTREVQKKKRKYVYILGIVAGLLKCDVKIRNYEGKD